MCIRDSFYIEPKWIEEGEPATKKKKAAAKKTNKKPAKKKATTKKPATKKATEKTK